MKPYGELKVGDVLITRSGRKVEVLALDGRLSQPIVGLLFLDNEVSVEQWNMDGTYEDHKKFPFQNLTALSSLDIIYVF